MRRRGGRRIVPVAALAALGLFAVSAQVAPFLHTLDHRADHVHTPSGAVLPIAFAPTIAAEGHGHSHAAAHDHDHPTGHHHHAPAVHAGGGRSGEGGEPHGRGSIAHFSELLLPPPAAFVFLPVRAARPAAVAPRLQAVATTFRSCPQPRGPPA